MSDSGKDGRYFWCVRHNRVESDADSCPAKNQIGPFSSADEASRALETVRQRNEAWEAEDQRWTGER